MDYEAATDFEINKAVAVALGRELAGDFSVTGSSVNLQATAFNDHRVFSEDVDYCNNPSDAWPIILEHGISLSFLPASETWAASDSRDKGDVFHVGKSPLRAAMIVFLKMKEE